MVYYETIQTEQEMIEYLRREVLPYDDPKCEGTFNLHFEEKPTEDEINEWIMRYWIIPEKLRKKNSRELEQKIMKQIDASLIESRLVTISITQDLKPEEVKNTILKIVEIIKRSNYSWMINAHGTAEFYTDTGWNPHFHIYMENEKKPSVIAQTIRRKLQDHLGDKIYRVNGKKGNANHQEEYCLGNKIISKQPNQIKDKQFRQKWEIPDKFNF